MRQGIGTWVGIAGIVGMTLTLADAGCGSSAGGVAGTPSGTYCDVTTAGVEFCTGVSGGNDTSSFTNQCMQSGGKIVGSCPTANALGCCTIAGNGTTDSSCTYCPSVGTQDGARTACTMSSGTFTAGAVRSCGDASTGSSSGSAGDAGGEGGGHAMPGACMQTCFNKAPNNEMGCDPCIQANCPTEYAACQNDNESGGCINCAQLLQGGGSGIDCTNTPTIVANLLNCACQSTTCN